MLQKQGSTRSKCIPEENPGSSHLPHITILHSVNKALLVSSLHVDTIQE